MRSVVIAAVIGLACSNGSRAPSEPAPASSPSPVSIDAATAVVDASPPDAAPPPPRKPAPAPAPAPKRASGDPSACTTDGDCEIHCPSAPGCCSSSPCGCRGAIARGHEADVDRAYAATCDHAPRCPAVDCAYEADLFAACVNGHCVGRRGPGGP